MDAGTVVAICAVVIALASLAVSVIEARAVRDHRHRSVRPLLQLGFRTHTGETAGLVLVNSGIGPAVVTQADFTYDGQPMGRFNKVNVDRMRDQLTIRPSASTLGGDVHHLAVVDRRFLLTERATVAELNRLARAHLVARGDIARRSHLPGARRSPHGRPRRR